MPPDIIKQIAHELATRAHWRLLGLTLWQPWGTAVVHGPKDVENRTWAPPAAVLGTHIAIHAGRTVDADGLAFCRSLGFEPSSIPGGLAGGAIIGLARVVKVVKSKAGDPWFFGPVGWVLDDVIALPRRVECGGSQRLWSVPSWAVERIQAELQAVSNG